MSTVLFSSVLFCSNLHGLLIIQRHPKNAFILNICQSYNIKYILIKITICTLNFLHKLLNLWCRLFLINAFYDTDNIRTTSDNSKIIIKHTHRIINKHYWIIFQSVNIIKIKSALRYISHKNQISRPFNDMSQ